MMHFLHSHSTIIRAAAATTAVSRLRSTTFNLSLHLIRISFGASLLAAIKTSSRNRRRLLSSLQCKRYHLIWIVAAGGSKVSYTAHKWAAGAAFLLLTRSIIQFHCSKWCLCARAPHSSTLWQSASPSQKVDKLACVSHRTESELWHDWFAHKTGR